MDLTPKRDARQHTNEQLDRELYALLIGAAKRLRYRHDRRRAKLFSMNAAKLRSRMVAHHDRPGALRLARAG